MYYAVHRVYELQSRGDLCLSVEALGNLSSSNTLFPPRLVECVWCRMCFELWVRVLSLMIIKEKGTA